MVKKILVLLLVFSLFNTSIYANVENTKSSDIVMLEQEEVTSQKVKQYIISTLAEKYNVSEDEINFNQTSFSSNPEISVASNNPYVDVCSSPYSGCEYINEKLYKRKEIGFAKGQPKNGFVIESKLGGSLIYSESKSEDISLKVSLSGVSGFIDVELGYAYNSSAVSGTTINVEPFRPVKLKIYKDIRTILYHVDVNISGYDYDEYVFVPFEEKIYFEPVYLD